MSKRKLALVQVQGAYGANVYLPLATGCLWAYARTFPEVRDEWDSPIFLYRKEVVDKALAKLGDPLPELVCFSNYIWNFEFNRALARAIIEKSPTTTIVYGGVHIPDHPTKEWWQEHTECDFGLHGEGEFAFTQFLIQYAHDRDWSKVPCLSTREFQNERKFPDIAELRSPYLDGVFDELYPQETRWQVLQETDRGCPFMCSFCEWGAAALNKIRPFPLDRVLEEIDWIGRHKIDYVDGANANFGILQRDEQIAEAFVKTKEKYGYPEKFRTAFAKYTNTNISERIYRIAKMLHSSGQLKAVTLALQSTDEDVLEAIDRKNISMSNFKSFQDRYTKEGIPTYTELILGLPTETYESFKAGIDKILDAGQHQGLFIYMCTGLPNSTMTRPEYIEKHGLEFVTMRAMLSHGTPTPDAPDEWQPTIIATKTMPHEAWKETYLLSWLIQALHTTGLTQWWAKRERENGVTYTRFYTELLQMASKHPDTVLGRVYAHTRGLLEGAVSGGSWDNVLPEFSDISWPTDEGAFLMVTKELKLFYDELEFLLDMPEEQRQEGPPEIPPGKEQGYARVFWYGRKGDLRKELRKFVEESEESKSDDD